MEGASIGAAHGHLGHGVLAAAQLVANLRPAEPEKIRVRIAVIADGVAARHSLSHKIRTLANEPSNHEESRARAVPVEKIEELRRDGRIWPVVEGDGQLVR